MDAKSREQYSERKSCLVKQYNKYKIGDVPAIPGINGTINKDVRPVYVDGELTINENIADTGVSTSYRAYGMIDSWD